MAHDLFSGPIESHVCGRGRKKEGIKGRFVWDGRRRGWRRVRGGMRREGEVNGRVKEEI